MSLQAKLTVPEHDPEEEVHEPVVGERVERAQKTFSGPVQPVRRDEIRPGDLGGPKEAGHLAKVPGQVAVAVENPLVPGGGEPSRRVPPRPRFDGCAITRIRGSLSARKRASARVASVEASSTRTISHVSTCSSRAGIATSRSRPTLFSSLNIGTTRETERAGRGRPAAREPVLVGVTARSIPGRHETKCQFTKKRSGSGAAAVDAARAATRRTGRRSNSSKRRMIPGRSSGCSGALRSSSPSETRGRALRPSTPRRRKRRLFSWMTARAAKRVKCARARSRPDAGKARRSRRA